MKALYEIALLGTIGFILCSAILIPLDYYNIFPYYPIAVAMGTYGSQVFFTLMSK